MTYGVGAYALTPFAGEGGEAGPLYVATIELGDHTFTISSGDTAVDDAIIVLDELVLGWSIPESAPWPAQPDPVNCKMQLLVADVVDLSDVALGTPLGVVLADGDGNVLATFHGRITQEVAVVQRHGDLRMRYQLTADDYTVDLDEQDVTLLLPWPAESATARFARIIALAATVGIELVAPADIGTAAFAELAAATTTLGALVATHLEQLAIAGPYGPQRYFVAPVVTAGVLERFECVLLERAVDAGLLPGQLEVVDDLLTLTFPDPTADGYVDAGHIPARETKWTRLKFRAVNQVTATGAAGLTATASRPGTPVRLTVKTELTDADALELLAKLYLPEVDETLGWVADRMRLWAHLAPREIIPAWFPDHRLDPPTTTVYVMPIAVVGVFPPINLAGPTEVHAGQLSTVTLTLSKGDLLVDFALRRQLPLGVGDLAASWEWMGDEHPTLTWEDVDPDLSWYEARLARRP